MNENLIAQKKCPERIVETIDSKATVTIGDDDAQVLLVHAPGRHDVPITLNFLDDHREDDEVEEAIRLKWGLPSRGRGTRSRP